MKPSSVAYSMVPFEVVSAFAVALSSWASMEEALAAEPGRNKGST